MANKSDKWEKNVAGEFYVDHNCIDCDLCREIAPSSFHRDDEGGYSYVFRQPETAEELQLCAEALDSCPVAAIGADGKE